MRDEFPEHVKRILALRVGNRCSRPECRAATSGPQVYDDGAVNIGVAAHITAAAPGGPRFDPSLRPAERGGIVNALWLCQTCGTLIDRDPNYYTADLLRSWRDQAEAEAQSTLGRQGETTRDDAARTYERLVSETSDSFTLLLGRLNAFDPQQLFRLLDERTADFLREVSRYLDVMVMEPRIRETALRWGSPDRNSFEFFSFVMMARGFLLDRFLLRKDLAPGPQPDLPEFDVLMQRWYEAVLTNDRWLDEWSSPFTRDLADAQWSKIEKETADAYRGDRSNLRIVLPVLRVSLLQGMIAHNFLAAGAPGRDAQPD